MQGKTVTFIENFNTNYASKLVVRASKYFLFLHYALSFAFVCYYWSSTSAFFPLLIAFFLFAFSLFFFIVGYVSYLKHKQNKLYFAAIRPETIERRNVEIKYKVNFYTMGISSWSLSFNLIVPIIVFIGHFADSNKNKTANSIGFFYGAVAQNLSSVSLIQFSVGIWYQLLRDLKNNEPNWQNKLDYKVERMIFHGGWYCMAFSLLSVFLGGLGGIFTGETSSIVVFVIFLVLGIGSLIGYVIKINRS